MIISASRRTDIPAFYSQWLMNRIRAGSCTVPNPFNKQQVSHVSLLPEDVDVFAFWTRNPRPLMPHLEELDQRGFRYYFHFTLLNNPRWLDPKNPPLTGAIETFKRLSEMIGPDRVIWRYDPIVFTKDMGRIFHLESYNRIAEALRGFTHRSVISVVTYYGKTKRRIRRLKAEGVEFAPHRGAPGKRFDRLMSELAKSANKNEVRIQSCAAAYDWQRYGIETGKCIDDDYLKEVFGIQVGKKKHAGQRKYCGCVVSKDIGMYNTCLFGCQYCYATSSFDEAKRNYDRHDPHSLSMSDG